MSLCLIDGRPETRIPVDDRGLLYGDHLFETLAFHGGQAPLWKRHWRRLMHGCDVLGIAPPSEQTVLDECQLLCRMLCVSSGQSSAQSPGNSGRSWIVRVTVTRGSGGKAYWPDPDQPARRIIHARHWPEALEVQQQNGLVLVTSRVNLASGSMLAGLKHGNRLEQVLAGRDCAEQGGDEALVYDNQGCLAEAIAANLVLEIDQRSITPMTSSGVAGVGLAWLMDQAETDIAETTIKRQDVARASAIMVINSVTGIRPARSLDGRELPISERHRSWQQLWNQRLNPTCDF